MNSDSPFSPRSAQMSFAILVCPCCSYFFSGWKYRRFEFSCELCWHRAKSTQFPANHAIEPKYCGWRDPAIYRARRDRRRASRCYLDHQRRLAGQHNDDQFACPHGSRRRPGHADSQRGFALRADSSKYLSGNRIGARDRTLVCTPIDLKRREWSHDFSSSTCTYSRGTGRFRNRKDGRCER